MVYSTIVYLLIAFINPAFAENSCELKRKSYKYEDSTNFTVKTLQFLTDNNDDKLIVHLPPTGGSTRLDKSTAHYFCNAGVSTIILDSWSGVKTEYSTKDFSEHQEELASAKKALLTLTNNVFKDKKIAIFGLSKGAIGITVFKNSFKNNVKSAFLVVAGAPLHLTLSRAGAKALKEVREKRMNFYNLTQYEYDHLMKESLNFSTSNRSDQIKVAMVTSSRDTIVPTALQENLLEILKPKKQWISNRGHLKTIVNTHIRLKDDAFDFMINAL